MLINKLLTMKLPAIGVAVLIAIVLTLPAEGYAKRRVVCAPTYEPGVGPGYFCPPPHHRKRR